MSDFQNYLLITDLDGTFFAKGGRIAPRNLEAIARFQANGGLFTIATGRLHLNIRVAIPAPEMLCNAPAVMSNGSYLYDFRKRCALCERFLSEDDAKEIIRFTRAHFPDAQFRVSTPHSLRIEELTGYLAKDAKNYDPGALRVEKPAENWRMNDWYKIVYRGEPEGLADVRARVEETFGGRFSVTRSGTRTIEIQPAGCTKASGIAQLRALMARESAARRVIACGDFENDMEMLQAADIAVCPANALPQVKNISDFVLCSCDDGLIADVVAGLESGKIR